MEPKAERSIGRFEMLREYSVVNLDDDQALKLDAQITLSQGFSRG